jgi:hypothetical protein
MAQPTVGSWPETKTRPLLRWFPAQNLNRDPIRPGNATSAVRSTRRELRRPETTRGQRRAGGGGGGGTYWWGEGRTSGGYGASFLWRHFSTAIPPDSGSSRRRRQWIIDAGTAARRRRRRGLLPSTARPFRWSFSRRWVIRPRHPPLRLVASMVLDAHGPIKNPVAKIRFLNLDSRYITCARGGWRWPTS